MQENYKRGGVALISILSIILSAFIIIHYWKATTYYEIRQIPIAILVFLAIYVLLQFVKRYLSEQRWYDWIYYIGLIAVTLPYFLAKPGNFESYLLFAQLGVLTLLIPTFLDGYYMINKKK